jgi:hypothetical protein
MHLVSRHERDGVGAFGKVPRGALPCRMYDLRGLDPSREIGADDDVMG